MRSPVSEGDESMKANKNVMESKKSCICSPTSHAGSFRCHLHRATAAPTLSQNSPSCCIGTLANAAFKKLNSKPQDGQEEPILSRFGRASSSLKLKPISETTLPP